MIRHASMEVRTLTALACLTLVTILLLASAVVLATGASAASMRVKAACAGDYFAHCSKFAPNSQQTRDCMHDIGEGLSKRCVNALVADGEVSDQEVAEHTPRKHGDNDE